MITKDKFLQFERIRASGHYNMLNPIVRKILNLTRKDYVFLLEHYLELKDKYKEELK